MEVDSTANEKKSENVNGSEQDVVAVSETCPILVLPSLDDESEKIELQPAEKTAKRPLDENGSSLDNGTSLKRMKVTVKPLDRKRRKQLQKFLKELYAKLQALNEADYGANENEKLEEEQLRLEEKVKKQVLQIEQKLRKHGHHTCDEDISEDEEGAHAVIADTGSERLNQRLSKALKTSAETSGEKSVDREMLMSMISDCRREEGSHTRIPSEESLAFEVFVSAVLEQTMNAMRKDRASLVFTKMKDYGKGTPPPIDSSAIKEPAADDSASFSDILKISDKILEAKEDENAVDTAEDAREEDEEEYEEVEEGSSAESSYGEQEEEPEVVEEEREAKDDIVTLSDDESSEGDDKEENESDSEDQDDTIELSSDSDGVGEECKQDEKQLKASGDVTEEGKKGSSPAREEGKKGQCSPPSVPPTAMLDGASDPATADDCIVLD